MKLLLCCLTVLLLPTGPAPDVILPGQKGVLHELVLEWGEDQGQVEFWAWPLAGFGGPRKIVAGEPFRFSGKYGTRIYRFAAGEAWPDPRSWESPHEPPEGFLQSHPRGIPCYEINRASVMHPLDSVRSVYRVVGAQQGALQFEFVSEQRFDARGNLINLGALTPFLVGIALVGLVGLVRIARRPIEVSA